MPRITPGSQLLPMWLESAVPPPREQSPDEFRDWLAKRFGERSHDELLRQKIEIGRLCRAHASRLNEADAEWRRALRAFDADSEAANFRAMQRRMRSLNAAVAGLSRAVAEGRADALKLADTESELRALEERFRAATSIHAEWNALQHARTRLDALEKSIGLTDALQHLKRLQRQRGTRANDRGREFERLIEQVVRDWSESRQDRSAETLHVLRGATLECPRGEFDALVVADRSREVVDCVAMFEAKRNPNDLASGFLQRQENLAWLTGADDGFDPRSYRSARFPRGRFEGIVEHDEEGRIYRFNATSFQQFRREAIRTTNAKPSRSAPHEWFLEGLYFVTTLQPLVGVSGSDLSSILHRAAREIDTDCLPDNLERLHHQAAGLADRLTTADVLRAYQDAGRPDQILIISEA